MLYGDNLQRLCSTEIMIKQFDRKQEIVAEEELYIYRKVWDWFKTFIPWSCGKLILYAMATRISNQEFPDDEYFTRVHFIYQILRNSSEVSIFKYFFVGMDAVKLVVLALQTVYIHLKTKQNITKDKSKYDISVFLIKIF